ncbi:hypothetical protein SAV14893_091140 [Streptomyces avermitilis]|uniref:Uncharacterized protein n=1 Tax=Streptomyces avermitilis TaxID=33903 RepID=A0A4D4N7M6_STRAX|nr:hypothetical protein SAVMC3_05380 [Streptomyces avermitilis]GDY69721.1 hypothetical protein SAV14893_091140 [Streptomyces avermitilis]GDY79974.1 hypothetical protein SAV31267_094590 [Streptomyces avermitilis]
MTRNVGALISGNRASHRTGIKIGQMSLLAVPILPEGLEGAVSEHGEQDADALAGEAEEGLGVGLAAGSFLS